MAVKAHLIQQSGLRQNEDGSFEQTCVYRVDGLSTASPASWPFQALSASDIPAHNAQHPVYGPLLRAKTRSVEPLSATQARVVVVYRSPSGGAADPPEVGEAARLSIGGSIESVLTNVDKDGNILTHEYTGFPTAYPQVQVDRVIPYLRYQQREVSTVSAMASKVATYMGKVNSATYLGHAPRTLKCFISADYDYTNEGGQHVFLVNYELYYNENTWDATTRYDGTDENGNAPTDMATSAQALKTHKVIAEVDFNGLGIV